MDRSLAYSQGSVGWRVNNTTAISLEGNLGLSEDDGMIGYVTDLKNMDILLGMTAIW